MKKIIILLLIIFFSAPLHAADISLPYSNTFDTQGDFDEATDTWGDNEAQTWYYDSTGGWQNSPCARSQMHVSGQDVQGGLGSLHWGDEGNEGTHTAQTNIGFLFYAGPNYASSTGDDQKFILFLDGEGSRPKVQQGAHNGGEYTTLAPCASAGGDCYFYGGGEWPDGTDPFHIEDYIGQWVWIEFEVIQNTSIKLYIYTQDEVFNGLYINNTTYGTNATSQYAVQHVVAYWADDLVDGSADAYFKIDNLSISTSFIGPPSGFTGGGGDTTDPVVTIATSNPQTITSDTITVTGTASDANGVETVKARIGSEPDDSNGTVCTGTTNWSCTITGFSEGANTLYVGAVDPSLNWGSDTISVTYSPTGVRPNRLPFEDNFETGDFSRWSGYSQAQTGLSVVTTGTPNGGSYHARATHTYGTLNDNYQEHFVGDFWALSEPTEKIEEIWFVGYVKFDSAYSDWPSDNVKVLLLNLTNGITGTRQYQVMIQARDFGDQGGAAELRIQYSYINTWDFFSLRQSGTPITITPGTWQKMKLHVVLNTAGVSDGVIQFWVDDTLKIDEDALNLRESTSYGIGKLILSSYTVASSLDTGYQYYDDWGFYETDPEGGDSTPPNVTITTSDPSTSLDGTISVAFTDSDDSGTISGRRWRIGAAPDSYNGTDVASSPASVTGLSVGANTVYIGAVDPSGNWGSDSITVNYNPSSSGGGSSSGTVSFK